MRNTILLLFISLILYSCTDDSLYQELDEIKVELDNQKKIIEKLLQNTTITAVEQTNGQYTIKFSDGQTITLKNGETPIVTIGDNGNWYINGVDTYKPSQGEDGKTPIIEVGENGNWFINGVDVGVKAEGLNGSDAPKIINIVDNKNEIIFYFSDETYIVAKKENEVYKTINYFSVKVILNNPFNSNANDTTYNCDIDHCLLLLPDNHTSTSKSLKLVVFWHGSGEPVYKNSSSIQSSRTANFFLKCGYAVLAVNGLPEQYAKDNDLSYGRPVGNWMATEAGIKAVNYVIENFNIKNEIYVYGLSQGGMTAENFVDFSNFNIKCVVLDSPAISMKYNQLEIYPAIKNIEHFYGFSNKQSFDIEKVLGCDPFTRNVNVHEILEDYKINNNVIDEDDLNNITSIRKHKVPLKIYLGNNDMTCRPYVAQIFVKQIQNYGGIAKYELYPNVGHTVDSNSNTIGYIINNNKKYNVSTAMYDMAFWFYRFGGYEPIKLNQNNP